MTKKFILELSEAEASALLTIINEGAEGLLTQKSGYLTGAAIPAARRAVDKYEMAWWLVRTANKHQAA